jgi:predicted enzyme related to lactoylglutathione lyase
MDYYMLQRNGESYCGVMAMDDQWEGIPPHWMGYFAVDDTDAALERVLAGGGKVLVPAFDMAYGRMAVIADPAGAAISIVKFAMM